MIIFFCILRAIIGYLILMFVGTNLIGLVVRDIYLHSQNGHEESFVLPESISSKPNIIMTIIFSLICILYLSALYYFWNLGILLSGIILMLTRLPDLLFELRTGEKIKSTNMPKRPIDILCTILSWLTLPLIWYSLCYFYFKLP